MVKFPIINLAFYGAYTVLLALPGTWSLPLNTTGDGLDISPVGNSPRSSLTKRAITVGVTCVGSWGAAVNAARSEALDIINYALPHFDRLMTNLNSNPVPSIIGMSTTDRTVFQTYEAFFGQTYFGVNTKANQASNALAIDRLTSLIDTARSIKNALENPASVNLEIHCGDSFLWDKDPWNYQDPMGQWDSRAYTDVNNPVGEWVYLQTCAMSPLTSAYTYHPNSPPFGGESVIVFCLDYFANWVARYAAGDTVGAYHDGTTLPSGQLQMDYLWGYMPATLIHELTHARSVMGSRQPLGDQCLINQQAAYQWQCIRELAQENSALAAVNSDSFSLFVTAIYFNMNDWSTGKAENLGFFPLVHS